MDKIAQLEQQILMDRDLKIKLQDKITQLTDQCESAENNESGVLDALSFLSEEFVVLKELLERIYAIRDLWLPEVGAITLPEHEGEAQALISMNNLIEKTLKINCPPMILITEPKREEEELVNLFTQTIKRRTVKS